MPELTFLLLDIGNTRLKWATATVDGPIRPRGDMPTGEATQARLRALAKEFSTNKVILSSVVPKLIPVFRSAFGARLKIIDGNSPLLRLKFDYPNPKELGADRLASAVAAHAEGIFPAIVVNCGTATAFTVLNREGELCGGVIAPGLQAQLAALLSATAQLPATDIKKPRQLPARSTQDAIRAGVLLNFQGGAHEILQQLCTALPRGSRPRILLTGGNASYLSEKLGYTATLRPLLVFEGLRIMGVRAFPPS